MSTCCLSFLSALGLRQLAYIELQESIHHSVKLDDGSQVSCHTAILHSAVCGCFQPDACALATVMEQKDLATKIKSTTSCVPAATSCFQRRVIQCSTASEHSQATVLQLLLLLLLLLQCLCYCTQTPATVVLHPCYCCCCSCCCNAQLPFSALRTC